MKYHDISEFGVCLTTVEDSQDYYFSFEKIEKSEEPVKNVTFTLGHGVYDGEKKTVILMENKDNAHVFIKCKAISIGTDTSNFDSFLMTSTGQSICLVYSKRYDAWFITGTGCMIISNKEKSRWREDPESVEY